MVGCFQAQTEGAAPATSPCVLREVRGESGHRLPPGDVMRNCSLIRSRADVCSQVVDAGRGRTGPVQVRFGAQTVCSEASLVQRQTSLQSPIVWLWGYLRRENWSENLTGSQLKLNFHLV